MFVSNVENSSVSTEDYANVGSLLSSLLLYKLSRYIKYFGPPILLLFGNFGNIMTILIMRRLKSGQAVINVYFAALAIVDLFTLDIFVLGQWVSAAFGYYIRDQSVALCKIYNWVTTACTTIGGWFLVGLTAHRAVSVVWPHRVNLLCTRRLVIGVIVGMAAFFAAVYSHYLYGSVMVYDNKTDTYYCDTKPGSYYAFDYEVFSKLDLVLYSLLPFTCIAVANAVLVWTLRAAVPEVHKKSRAEKESEKAEAREKAAKAVTLTVILVSMAYVVLTLPVTVYAVSAYAPSSYATGRSAIYERAKRAMISSSTYFLMFSNSAVNFYLYCLTGHRFRKEFVRLVCPTRART